MGRGSKANHLSYLGDTTIGEKVNVGAGTITCNYDGYEKFQTVIEDGAFIGSDSQLVAPVRIGKRAVVGAGTTVTRDVAAGALALVARAADRTSGLRRQGRRAIRRSEQRRAEGGAAAGGRAQGGDEAGGEASHAQKRSAEAKRRRKPARKTVAKVEQAVARQKDEAKEVRPQQPQQGSAS